MKDYLLLEINEIAYQQKSNTYKHACPCQNLKHGFTKQAKANGTTSFYESLTPDDVPVEYHKYFERKWRADKEAAENGEPPKKYRAI